MLVRKQYIGVFIMELLISLDNLISALSLSLDLAENKKLEHARRTAYIALNIAESLTLAKDDLSDIYYGALLHDIGKAFIGSSIDEDHGDHSEVGALIVGKLPHLDSIKPLIQQHHDRWDGKGFPHTRQGNEINLGARIIHIADQLEYHLSLNSNPSPMDLINFLEINQGKAFDPIISSACKSLLKRNSFFKQLTMPKIDQALQKKKPKSREIQYNDLEIIGEVFADLIDRKSPYTASHSTGVAEISEQLAKKVGLSLEICNKIKISGLLHDIGKMAIPNAILDKPGKLTPQEYELIQSHSYYTEKILNEIPAMEDIKIWSSMHHEKLDGSGYHNSTPGEIIPLEARIIAMADIYHALTDDRPYRKGLDKEQALEIIKVDCEKGKLDYSLYEVIKEMDLKKLLT
jgi:putative nucleotidyltransferase with HDIG domain